MHDQIFTGWSNSDRQTTNQFNLSEPCDINIYPNFPQWGTAPLKYITPLKTNGGM